MAAFELTKWYADCVSGEGEAAIVYHAKLRWGAGRVHYASLLTRRPGCPARAQYSLRKRPEPAVEGDEIVWQSPDWKVAGTWRDHIPGYREVLYKSEHGLLDWNCVAPRAEAEMQIGSEPPVRGWGYVERLRLTLAPWRLPIRRLRWGRFINATDTLAWIDWTGSYNKRVVYLNGAIARAAEISDAELVLSEGGVLSLDRETVLREGKLASTALSMIPDLDRIFPNSILNVHECKWLSRAVLRRPGQPDSTGMTIHEVVEWP